MKLNDIKDNDGANPSRRRVGRGIGSSKGKTGGRGVKGQKSRSGVAINGFEGGQMPIYRRLPKRGFSNAMFAKDFNEVSLGRLQVAIDAGKLDANATVDAEALVKAGVIRRVRDGVRLLSDGDIKAKVTVSAAGASKAAIAKLEKAGGKFELAGETGDVPFVDDVILIDGIGTKTARALRAAGVSKLSELVAMDDAALAKISKASGTGSAWKSGEWKVQAQEMIDGKPPRAQVDRDLARKMAEKSGK
ncbi:MAG: 50S ribosomal protein L15 [Nitratireductor sp.]|nr:50S ribosomal protein L15 [Nitratireductor sp.]